jgi:hypothetical protein
VKMRRWLVSGLLVAGCLLSWLAPAIRQQAGGEGLGGFAAFRKARLELPERYESICPGTVGDIINTWGVSPAELEGLGLVAGRPAKNGTEGEDSNSLAAEGKNLAESRLTKVRYFDLDGDGIRERYSLRDGIIKAEVGSRLIWESPASWWVDYFFLGDANNDGWQELNLLVWKEGSFGPQQPFWVEGEDRSIKNHLFIFKLEEGEIKPVWQSSNLDRPNLRAALIDGDGDGKKELLALEGSYTDSGKFQLTLWEWNGWGFSRLR